MSLRNSCPISFPWFRGRPSVCLPLTRAEKKQLKVVPKNGDIRCLYWMERRSRYCVCFDQSRISFAQKRGNMDRHRQSLWDIHAYHTYHTYHTDTRVSTQSVQQRRQELIFDFRFRYVCPTPSSSSSSSCSASAACAQTQTPLGQGKKTRRRRMIRGRRIESVLLRLH